MKNVFLFVLLTISSVASSQCIPENFCNECIGKLIKAKFNYLKSFKINGEDGSLKKIEYSYVLTKGSKYLVNICASGTHPEKIGFTLLNYQRVKMGTNSVKGTHVSDFVFECNTTGIYYLQYSFEEASINCAGSALGFTR